MSRSHLTCPTAVHNTFDITFGFLPLHPLPNPDPSRLLCQETSSNPAAAVFATFARSVADMLLVCSSCDVRPFRGHRVVGLG